MTVSPRTPMPAAHPTVVALMDLEPVKTWSLIVTLFGDLDGDELTGRQINGLLGHIGIKPETIRVALHRLKSDGWITSDRRGREAVYMLTDTATKETQAVTRDVYGLNEKHPGGWHFALSPSSDPPTNGVLLTREVSLLPADQIADTPDVLRLTPVGRDMPQWVEDALLPADLRRNANALIRSVSDTPRDLQAFDRTAHRALVLHHWRRLALRRGTWAHIGVLPEGLLATCRRDVTTFLNHTPRISF